MEHKDYKELIQLALMNELNDDELKELHNHLIECSECQAEFDELNKYLEVLNKKRPREIDEQFLQDARRKLRQSIDYEVSKKSFVKKVFDSISKNIWIYRKPALAGAFSLCAGVFLGYLIFSSSSSNLNSLVEKRLNQSSQTKITNIRFSQPPGTNGQVEFTFDAVNPVTMKGNINDPEIKNVLAKALLNEKNPGARLQTVNALSNQTNINGNVDSQVKTALISSAKHDGNPGVRRDALNALLKMPYDTSIKNCLLYVLTNDKNAALRITAINGLASATMSGKPLDPETIKVLDEKAKQDNNDYIKIRAASLIKEEKLQ